MTNAIAYNAAMDTARLLGGNFKVMRDRKRALAVNLVTASVVEGFALAEAITDAKKVMKWTKLASDEQNQMNVLFTAVRVIDGAWKTLSEDVQKAFLAGEKIFSTLVKEIKDAEKAALEADAKAEEQEQEQEQEQGETPPVEQVQAQAQADPVVAAADYITGFVKSVAIEDMSEDQSAAIARMVEALDAAREAALELLKAA